MSARDLQRLFEGALALFEPVETQQRDALKTGNFTLSSGRSSHYYIDGRKVTLAAEGATLIGAGVCDLLSARPQIRAVAAKVT